MNLGRLSHRNAFAENSCGYRRTTQTAKAESIDRGLANLKIQYSTSNKELGKLQVGRRGVGLC